MNAANNKSYCGLVHTILGGYLFLRYAAFFM